MPNNEQKRAAAKRKLQRQLARREERERQRRRLTLALSAAAVLALAAGGAFWWHKSRPKPAEPAVLSCAFEAGHQAAAKPVDRPSNGPATTEPATQDVTIRTDQGDIPISLDRAQAPCATQSFLSLAHQNFFNDTTCHRLTTEGIFVLQCGDPTGTGTGGPGYSFADEHPVAKDKTKSVLTAGQTDYTRGTLAMANSGPDTNGSQFFLVYKDSPLPPNYTVFGRIGEAGLAVLDKVAAGGVAPPAGGATAPNQSQPSDGAPKIPVKITAVSLDPAPESPAPAQPQPVQPAPAGH